MACSTICRPPRSQDCESGSRDTHPSPHATQRKARLTQLVLTWYTPALDSAMSSLRGIVTFPPLSFSPSPLHIPRQVPRCSATANQVVPNLGGIHDHLFGDGLSQNIRNHRVATATPGPSAQISASAATAPGSPISAAPASPASAPAAHLDVPSDPCVSSPARTTPAIRAATASRVRAHTQDRRGASGNTRGGRTPNA